LASQIKSVTGTANVAAHVVVNVKEILLISNDGLYDITFNFDGAVDGEGAFILKPNESVTDWKIAVHKLHFTADDATPFRFIGIPA
jgi:heme-binding NEAT domain protein